MTQTRIITVYAVLALLALLVLALSLISGSIGMSLARTAGVGLSRDGTLAHALIFELQVAARADRVRRRRSARAGRCAHAGIAAQPAGGSVRDGRLRRRGRRCAVRNAVGLGGFAIDASAAAGALITTLLVFALAHGEGGWTPVRLLLTGVVVAAGASAVVSMLLALGDETKLRGMMFWLMGDLSLSSRPGPLLGRVRWLRW